MKILVTGGAGFIGSAVVRQAIMAGHQVVNLDCLTYAGCLDNLDSVAASPRYAFEQVDICNRVDLKRVFASHQPDAVLHLAAESHVDRSIDAPDAFIQTNIVGTFNLLTAAREYWEGRQKPDDFRFLHISTDEVYGSLGADGLFSENSQYDPRSPYSASKAASDHLVRAWGTTYGLPILLTNCSNNYGPFQYREKLIPLVINKALAGDMIPIYGNGENIRDWLFVQDHAKALLCVLAKGQIGRSYNIGAGSEVRNIDIAQMICGLLDQRRPKSTPYGDQIQFVTDRPGHDMRYAIDASRIRDELGWRPLVSLQQGLAQTVDWYLKNRRPLL